MLDSKSVRVGDRVDQHPFKQIADAVAYVSTLGVLAGWLPPIAAVFTIVWTGIQTKRSTTTFGKLGLGGSLSAARSRRVALKRLSNR